MKKPVSAALLRLAASDALVAEMIASNLPLTKAMYLRLMVPDADLTFPLHAELIHAVPRELAGKVPRSRRELFADSIEE